MGNADKKLENDQVNTAKGAARSANFELLRILCMAMIVLGHCFTHGGAPTSVTLFSVNWFVCQFVPSFLHVGVNCYVLISGYFLCESSFKAKRLLGLWTTTLFWSVGLHLFSVAISHTNFSLSALMKSALPITQSGYWFVTTYLLMYLFVPFLNHAIRHMTKKQHGGFLLIYFAVFIVLQNFTFWTDFTQSNAHSPLYFIFLYMTAAYIRKYPPAAKRHWGLFYLLISLLIFLWKAGISIITISLKGEAFGETAFSSFNSITVYLASVFLFLAFKELNIKSVRLSKLIVFVSALTFGVYLIHDHNDIRSLLWNKIFPSLEWVSSPFMILWIFAASAVVFVACLLLEYVRKLIWKLLRIDHLLELIGEKLTVLWQKLVDRLFKSNVEGQE